jgi:hypothetical protein
MQLTFHDEISRFKKTSAGEKPTPYYYTAPYKFLPYFINIEKTKWAFPALKEPMFHNMPAELIFLQKTVNVNVTLLRFHHDNGTVLQYPNM